MQHNNLTSPLGSKELPGQSSSPLSLLPRKRPLPATLLADPCELLGVEMEIFQLMGHDPAKTSWGRKCWEWYYLVESARKLGLLNPEVRAIGTGAGKEPLIFYFARHLKEVVATDLYSDSTMWHEARCAGVEHIYESAPFDFPRDRLNVYSADMRQIPEDSESFDFVWSCGSLEHVPTLYDTYEALKEAHRLLRPGGYALITTEYCLSEAPYLLAGMNALDVNTVHGYLNKLGGFELHGPINLTYNWLAPAGAVRPRRYLENTEPTEFHAGYLARDFVHMVGISAITPIGFVLKKVEGRFSDWSELSLPEEVAVFEYVRRVGDPAEVQKYVVDYLLGNKPCSTQLRLLMFMQWVNARSAISEYTSTDLKQDFALMETLLPPGGLQDPNLLEFCAGFASRYKLWEHTSRYLYLASRTPSSLGRDAIRLSALAVVIGKITGESEAMETNFRDIVFDLLSRGFPAVSIRTAVSEIKQFSHAVIAELQLLADRTVASWESR